MVNVSLTVHRSTQSIGGNCIEISTSDGNRVLLDIGRPLDAQKDATNLLPDSLVQNGTVDGILISHPHQDHYGLLEEAPNHWPVYCGEATGKLIRMTSGIFGKTLECSFNHWHSGKPLAIGPFTVTPYLTDHSAFDAYMLQIDVAGKRIFYSGDFRIHGRKASLVEKLMASPPSDIDVLLMEGTNLGSDKPCMTEDDLEQDYVKLFKETKGRVFVTWSAQNIDRTVTLFRACKRASRTLVIDLYTAEVMDMLASKNRIPKPDWDGIKVVVTRSFARMYKRTGREAFVDRMAKNGIAAKKLNETPDKWVIMTRPSLIRDYQFNNVTPDANDAWSWGMWMGYLRNDDGVKIKAWFDTAGSRAAHIHTSGHASPGDLRTFAMSMKAKTMVPIHGLAWDTAPEGFPSITRLQDNEPLRL
jgi:ribonuclease J